MQVINNELVKNFGIDISTKVKTYFNDCQTQSGYFVKVGSAYCFAPLMSKYGQLIEKYDLLCAIYEDSATNEQIQINNQLKEIEKQINKIERNY